MNSPTDLPTACLALVQVVDELALRARVPTAMNRGMELVQHTIESLATRHQGTVVPSIARGTTVSFDDAANAVAFAVELQRALLAVDWPPTLLVRTEAATERGPDQRLRYRGLRTRVGLHRGRATIGPDGRLGGPGVYHVARAVSLAAGGQVLLTDALWRRLRGPLPGTVVLRDLGEHHLPGVDGLGRLFQVLPEELDGRVFPELGSGVGGTSRLLRADDPLLGRQADLAALQELVAMGVRIVSVVGPFGVGKSRLCRQFARTRAFPPAGPRGPTTAETFVGGVWWIRPSEPRVAAVVRSVANALGVPLDEARTPAESVQRVGYALSHRGRMLVVLDHLPRQGPSDPELSALLDAWLRLAPFASFVINTDVRWGLPGEVSYLLRPLPAPATEDPRHAEAVQLFAARARIVDTDFTLDDPATIAEIAARVGGLPLSLRMLAGVVDRFPVERQAELLRAGDLPPERILDLVLAHLDPDERRVLATCCAMPGSFEPGVLGVRDERGDPLYADLLLASLERRGLVRGASDPEAPEIRRYLVEPDVRRRVLEELEVEDLRSLRDLRAQSLVGACERWAGRPFHRDRPELVARLVVEWDGLLETVRAGLDPERDDLDSLHVAARAVLLLRPVLEARGPAWFAAELLDATMRKLDAILGAEPLLQVRLLQMRAAVGRRLGRAGQALQDLARAESIAQRWSDAEGLAQCRVELGRIQAEQGDPEPALRSLEGAIETWTELGDAHGEAVAATYLGSVLMGVGRYDEAERHLHRALDQFRRGEQRFHEARALNYLALLHRRTGRPDTSRSLYQESLRILREFGAAVMESRILAELGLLDLNLNRVDEARRVLDRAVDVARSVGDRTAEGIARRDLGIVEIVAGDLSAAREELLAAVAIHRDRGERAAEGADAGCVGWVLHLEDRLDEARQEYRRALDMLEGSGQPRLEALFAGWLAACEAERGDLGAARGALEIAAVKHRDTLDPQIGEALEVLRIPVERREIELAERGGDPVRAAELQATVDAHFASRSGRDGSAFALIARRRVPSPLAP